MIARTWAARASVADAPAYAAHLRNHVIPTLRGLDGYRGARLMQRQDGDEMEIVVVTWWESLAAIHGFAGADIERAVVEDEAARLLIDFEERVQHYDLVLSDDL